MTVRRAAGALIAVGLVLWGALPCPSATAQATLPVRLTLVGQSPWTTNDASDLHVSVLATNDGPDTLHDLSLVISIGEPFVTRFEYETSLSEGPSTIIASQSVPLHGTLDPGSARVLRTKIDVTTWPVNRDDSRVYPLRIQVLQRGTTVGTVGSVEIHLVRTPEVPMLFSWWVTLSAPPAFDPKGTLVDPSLEAALQPEGALGAPMEALQQIEQNSPLPVPIDVVVEPSLLAQLQDMSNGFARSDGTQVPAGSDGATAAARFLDDLRALGSSPNIELIGLPYAAPSIPALLGSDLEDEAKMQLFHGTQTIRSILGVSPSTAVARPPNGLMDGATLSWLAAQGRRVILADPDEIERPVPLVGTAPDPSATVTIADGGTSTLVLPDPGTDALLHRTDVLADPLRAAQAVLGELAVIWKEAPAPSPPTQRGIAVALPPTLPPRVWAPLLGRLANAPFLRQVHPADLASGVYPPGAPASLTTFDAATFSPSYAGRIRELRPDIFAYASMLPPTSDVPAGLRDDLLLAGSATYVGNEGAGQPWLDAVAGVTQRAFANTSPQVQQLFTFTSRQGTIPLRMGDPGATPLTVIVRMRSSQFEFPDGKEQIVELQRPDQIVTFRVVAKAAGRNPINVVVLAPSGKPISDQTIVVGTTAVNGFALALTLFAAAGLLLLYARRWVRRRKA